MVGSLGLLAIGKVEEVEGCVEERRLGLEGLHWEARGQVVEPGQDRSKRD